MVSFVPIVIWGLWDTIWDLWETFWVERPREVEDVHGVVRAHREREVHSQTPGVQAEAIVSGFWVQGSGFRA